MIAENETRPHSKILSKLFSWREKFSDCDLNQYFFAPIVVLHEEKYHHRIGSRADLALSIQLIIGTTEKRLGCLD